jgi:hypothetical protein
MRGCTPRKERPANCAGQAGQAALGFVRFVGESRPSSCPYPAKLRWDETRAVRRP